MPTVGASYRESYFGVIVRLADYRIQVEKLPCGKRLPNAVYLHIGSDTNWAIPPLDLVRRYVDTHQLGDFHNVGEGQGKLDGWEG